MHSPEFALRQATQQDAALLALLGAATFLESYAGWLPGSAIVENCLTNHTPDAWLTTLAKSASACWLATVAPDAAPVGYALLSASPEFPAELLEHGDAELKRLYVFSRFHGAGIGQSLMTRALEHARGQDARRVLLGTHADNRRALSFYGRNGFQEIGRREFQVGCCRFNDPVLARVVGTLQEVQKG